MPIKLSPDAQHDDDFYSIMKNSLSPKSKVRSPQPKSENHHSSSRNGHSKKDESKSKGSGSDERSERKSSDSKHRHHSSSHSSSSSSSSKRKHESTSDKPKDTTHTSHKKPKLEETSKDLSGNSKHRESTSSSGSSSKSKENLHKRKSEKREADEEVDGSQGMGFAEALALFDMPSTSKKHSKDLQLADKITKVTKSSSSKSSRDEKRSSSTDIAKRPLKHITALTAPPKLLTQKPKLEPLPDIVLSSDVSIPEYRPSVLNSAVKDYINTSVYGNSSQSRPVKQMTDKELLTESFSSKANRTRVYSGNRVQRAVPTLFEMCIRVLQENIEFLECTGGVPFDILKPVLERAKPEQLLNIEYYNP